MTRISQKLWIASAEGESESYFLLHNSSPYISQTSVRQLAPTVKPMPLHSLRQNENQSPKRVVFSLLFLTTVWKFRKILMRSSPSRVTGIRAAALWVYTQRNTELVCVLQYDKQKYNTKNACVLPPGWKSWRALHISIKIMQSVMLWLSG